MSIRDQVIADAKDVPSLLNGAQEADPELYAVLTGGGMWKKYVKIGAAGVAWVAAKFGLGWDTDTCTAIAGFLLVVGAYIEHKLQPRLAPPPAP